VVHQPLDEPVLGQAGHDLPVLEDQAHAPTAGDAQVGHARLARPVDRAAHDRHLDRRWDGAQPPLDFLRDLKAAARAAGIPAIWIAPEQASFMQILLALAGAREVVEVGTLAGYSAICMARALPPGGRVRTIELLPAHADFASTWAARSDVADRVQVHRGAGQDVLPTFAADSADAAFLDADKSGYPNYLRECLRIVRRGGLIMVDNAFAFGQLFDEHPTDREVPAVRQFNDLMAATSELHSIIVPVGDGLWVGVRR
jgi:O-methyltransferase